MNVNLKTVTQASAAALLVTLSSSCSNRPEDGTVVSGDPDNPSTNSGNGNNAGAGGGMGAGGDTSVGGSVSSGGEGVPVDVDDASCAAFSPMRAQVVSPMEPNLPNLVGQVPIEERLAMLNGGQRLDGDWWLIDFDATGAPSLDLDDMPMRDGPRGVSQLNNGQSTTFAVSMARGASFDKDLEYRVGQTIASEMRAFKYDVMLGPTMNILRHPGWGRAQETYGEDPVHVGEMAAAHARGVQDGGIIACPKHFTVNNTENNRGDGAEEVVVNMVVDSQTLHENYLKNFQIVVEKADPACIMAAYNLVNGARCTQNSALLTTVLRDEWGWEGFVVSDWWGAQPGAGAASLNAGLDLEMPDNNSFATHSSDLQNGGIDVARVDEAVGRIVNARLKFGHDTDAYKNSAPNAGIVNDAAHQSLAQETAEKGAVLLKNDSVLPIDKAASIVVLGPDANRPHATTPSADNPSGLGDRGSSRTVPPHAVSFLAGLQAAGTGSVTSSDSASAAANADIAIIPVTMDWVDEGEGYNEGQDRESLTLAGPHPKHWTTKPAQFIAQAVAAKGPNTRVIVVLAVGSAVIMEDWIDSVDAVVQSFYPGQEGGTAFARLVFGDINFSGKLPFTIARAAPDYPPFQNNMGGDANVEYLHGYRRFEATAAQPRFWFGHGLSYTTYEYGDPEVLCTQGISSTGRLNVNVDVTNSGDVAGEEIVQLYIGYPNTAARRPVKELKAFTRVALDPGETKTVQLQVPARDMAYWSQDGWVVETGEHIVFVGPSADPAQLKSATFTIN